MYLGIDVGGTHTDAVVLHEGVIVAQVKVVTDHENLLASVRAALAAVLEDVDPARVSRFNLSTTLSTNSIVEGKTEDVGVFVAPGPGVDTENFRIGGYFYILPGSIDHRGKEIQELGLDELAQGAARCREAGVRVFASVGKFSTRNPAHETLIADALAPQADHVTMGHRLSGMLNFPRRVSTAYYNAAVWRTYNAFADAVEKAVAAQGLTCPCNILKADGGTMPLSVSRQTPVESILSGPAASVMGIIALCTIHEDCVILDIGGTTTDIAVFASGTPLLERDGIDVGSYPTLVRALKTVSIGIGGDSHLHLVAGEVRVGPERRGLAMALGGAEPTLIDAVNHLDIIDVGDKAASSRGIERLAALWDIFPDKLARAAVDFAVARIKAAVDDMVWDVNEKPVYTIIELLQGKKIDPTKIYLMGGPAKAFQGLLAEAFGRTVVVPKEYAVANAIGAALTRTTCEVELFADTQKRSLFIPTLGIQTAIEQNYKLPQAEEDARRYLREYLESLGAADEGAALDIVESSSFNMVGNMGTQGRNIRVKCQIRPGILSKAGRRSNA